MRRKGRSRLLGVGALALALAGCTSGGVTGHGSQAAAGRPDFTGGAAPSIGSASRSATTGPPTSTAAPTTGGLCATATTPNSVAQCVRSALSDFWSGQLNQVVSEPVYLDAKPAQVPARCRAGIDATPAFTCRINLTLYINKSLLDLIEAFVPRPQLGYAFAAVQAHEIGHVVQLMLHQPQIELEHPTNEQVQFVEQQADCLSGVWAHDAAGLGPQRFRAIAVRLVTLISSNPEIATHGTPAQRAAAIDRGLASGRPQSCRLVTFS